MDKKIKIGITTLLLIVSISTFISAACIDSDGGKEYYIKGDATFESRYVEDYCSSKYVVDLARTMTYFNEYSGKKVVTVEVSLSK